MPASYCRLMTLAGLLALGTACNDVQTATDLQHAQMDRSKSRYSAHHSYMIDNAILHDMSVADIHFIPHSAEISGVGEARLNRMAKLLNTYGGTVRYETLSQDEELIEQRLTHVREYLTLTGCNMDRVEVAAMMSGGRGMPGDEAVEKFNKGTAKPEGESRSMTFAPMGTGS